MKKRKQNIFAEKFQLLNSQKDADEINWSSSSSSDHEPFTNTVLFDKTTNVSRCKRKRKKKVPNNISNLDISILNVGQDHKHHEYEDKSPILRCKDVSKVSPILNSPILLSKINSQRSPVLPLKIPKSLPEKVKKKLFESDHSGTTNSKNFNKKLVNKNNFENRSLNSFKSPFYEDQEGYTVIEEVLQNIQENRDMKNKFKENFATPITSENQDNVLKARENLVNKVKVFFDSNFSSESGSQNSISDIPTPKDSSTNVDNEILTCKTQLLSNVNSQTIKQEAKSSGSSDNSMYNIESVKKIKYKKDGLAYRLCTLIKKQNSNVSLWQHEKFLAVNSNFVIPKEDNLVFRVQNVHCKFGCYILEAVDVNDKLFTILINDQYVSENVVKDSIFKIFKPYNILDYNGHCKLILNVCKFEHIQQQ